MDHLGRFAGTPAYMAPEALGGDELLDTAADLWSFGVVLFECLTGERPFAQRPLDATDIDWVREIQAHAPECPAALGELVGDLLAADKRRRPPRPTSSGRACSNRLHSAWRDRPAPAA